MIDRSWSQIELTTDPLASRFPQLAQDQVTAGVAKTLPNLDGFVDLGPLNTVLQQAGQPPADQAGLGR